ncbi:MAG: hypothetical protein ABIU97_07995 [Dehalococcoidia bacterium]
MKILISLATALFGIVLFLGVTDGAHAAGGSPCGSASSRAAGQVEADLQVQVSQVVACATFVVVDGNLTRTIDIVALDLEENYYSDSVVQVNEISTRNGKHFSNFIGYAFLQSGEFTSAEGYAQLNASVDLCRLNGKYQPVGKCRATVLDLDWVPEYSARSIDQEMETIDGCVITRTITNTIWGGTASGSIGGTDVSSPTGQVQEIRVTEDYGPGCVIIF